ncbi:LysR family transcriptional regulator [Burkholderia oklahomensis]|uniref:LysR family transcriptional regulator n=1 Tax=Burkholderia oklahomensis TaxID=342113 RepID=UPI0005D7E541|nr:LysR family transcriptional regulator [Burkholderia oklahomensis]AJX33174.1 bacterial regulatory helix-turn-helix, lysR family protein [Burkholderia oklahomensis C6786]MBI0358367.1 LysR family transcriptional regulator [Burkholderia oklahomensis]SUW56421.1 CysJI operon transcriptional activator [Burkholderia oklahomensis]
MTLTNHFIMDRIDWNLLRTYRVIMQEKSISRTAIRMHLTQSAISASLRRLEETVGSVLIYRQRGQFNPTPAGQRIYDIASNIYEQMSLIEADLNAHDDEKVTGTVRVLSIGDLIAPKYEHFLADFRKAYPHAMVSVELFPSDDISTAIAQRTATCGITFDREPRLSVEYAPLARESYSFFCGKDHRLFGINEISVTEIREEALAVIAGDKTGRNSWPLQIAKNRFDLIGDVVARSESINEVRRLVVAGYGIGLLPNHSVQEDVVNRLLWRLPIENCQIDIGINFIWNSKKRMNKSERIFIDQFSKFLAHSKAV